MEYHSPGVKYGHMHWHNMHQSQECCLREESRPQKVHDSMCKKLKSQEKQSMLIDITPTFGIEE